MSGEPTAEATVEVLLFGRLREAVGQRSLRVALRPGTTAIRLWSALEVACPGLHGADAGVRVAVNEEYAGWNTAVGDGDVVAFLPPVAGGAGERVDVRVTDSALDASAVERSLLAVSDGAVCTFSGVVRDHDGGRTVTALTYEAYPAMAEAEMLRIGRRVLAATGARAIALHHRHGRLEVGEVAVVVCAVASHREAAFAACRAGIDEVKRDAPIWKREEGPAGERWVEGNPAG